MAEFKGYDMFDDVENNILRAWNRCQTIMNIIEVHGKELSQEYLLQFNKISQLQIAMMFALIKKDGVDAARKLAQEAAHEATQ